MHLAHLDKEGAGRDENKGSNDPDRIDGVTEEFMVCLARAVNGHPNRGEVLLSL